MLVNLRGTRLPHNALILTYCNQHTQTRRILVLPLHPLEEQSTRMFRAAPPSERKPSTIERASYVGNPGVERFATRGARRYPFRLNFYREPPVHEVTIEQFETWAIDRLRGMCNNIGRSKFLTVLCSPGGSGSIASSQSTLS